MPKKTEIHQLADKLGNILLKRKLRCAVAESCTGGGLAAAITEIAGSSQWFDRGFVTYSNESKIDVLAVPADVVSLQGAVSEVTVRAMAQGVIAVSDAQVSIAISGIAGPGGGSFEKPVGTVWIAWAGDLQPTHTQCYFFKGDRVAIRQQAVKVALEGLIQRCDIQVTKRGSARYFFACWPDDKTRQELYKRSTALNIHTQGKTVCAENLHMTLVYLGRVTSDALQSARQIAKEIQIDSFAMSIASVNYWQHAHLFWLGLNVMPPELEELVKCLNHGLIAAGFKPEKSTFIPHVSIARNCTQIDVSEPMEHLSWFVHEFFLVKSTGVVGQSNYEVIDRWPLRG